MITENRKKIKIRLFKFTCVKMYVLLIKQIKMDLKLLHL